MYYLCKNMDQLNDYENLDQLNDYENVLSL
jgi:hypothetical protein